MWWRQERHGRLLRLCESATMRGQCAGGASRIDWQTAADPALASVRCRTGTIRFVLPAEERVPPPTMRAITSGRGLRSAALLVAGTMAINDRGRGLRPGHRSITLVRWRFLALPILFRFSRAVAFIAAMSASSTTPVMPQSAGENRMDAVLSPRSLPLALHQETHMYRSCCIVRRCLNSVWMPTSTSPKSATASETVRRSSPMRCSRSTVRMLSWT